MSYEYYTTLELEPEASAKEIKRAYYRLIRLHPPEKDAEAFQTIREAYDTLSDPTAKQHYDSMQEGGGENQKLLSQAEEKIAAKEWGEAIKLLKHLLVLSPGNDVVSNRLGLCFIHQKDYDSAIKIYQSLSESNPDVLSYWIHFGQAFRLKADDVEDQDRCKNLYQSARNCFEKAIELDLFNSEPFILIAKTLIAEGHKDKAIEWLNKAVGADGKLDIQDFDALFLACQLHVSQDEFGKAEETVKRIEEALQGDQEAFMYASVQFAQLCNQVLQIAKKDALNPDILQMALSFAEASYRFDPKDDHVLEMSSTIFTIIQIHKELQKLIEDRRLVQGVKDLGFSFACSVIMGDEGEERSQFMFQNALASLDNTPAKETLESLDLLRCEYPEIFDLRSSLLKKIESTVQENYRRQHGWSWSSNRTAKPRQKYESSVHREQKEKARREEQERKLAHEKKLAQEQAAQISYDGTIDRELSQATDAVKLDSKHPPVASYDKRYDKPKTTSSHKASDSAEENENRGCLTIAIVLALILSIMTVAINQTPEEQELSPDENTLLFEEGSLSSSDDEFREGRNIDTYSVNLEVNEAVQIDLSSRDFDPYLILADPDGEIIEENDDASGGTSDSQIVYIPSESGEYLIGVSSFQPSSYGSYRLRTSTSDEKNTSMVPTESSLRGTTSQSNSSAVARTSTSTPRTATPQATPSPTPRETTNATVTGDSTYTKNVRSGINTDAAILFELPVGSRVQVISRQHNADNYLWYEIYDPHSQQEGWIASHLLDID